jgi:hypothetical protein
LKAIAYFSNGLGNFILMMPALQAVASMTDSKTIDICLDDRWRDPRRPAVEEICQAWPVIDRIISWPKDQFKEKDYDLWFYSGHGSSCDIVSQFLHNMSNRPIPKPSWRTSLIHESDHYMEIACAMGYKGLIPEVEFPVSVDPILDLPEPVIGICNGWFRSVKRDWQKKGWPHFGKLAETLKGFFGGSVIGIGRENEIPEDVKLDQDFTGKLSILQSASVLSQCDLFITTDTGPMHLANILNIPLIALFGGTLVSKNGPRGKRSTILTSREKCSPCQETTAFYNCKRNSCMELITVGDVMAKAKEKLNGTHPFK